MVTKREYDEDLVRAARSVMLELTRILGEYHEDIVLVGGWVPALLLPNAELPHIGSIDIDLALNHKTLSDPGYATIRRILLDHGYREDHRQPFIFWRTVPVDSETIEVEVDLLAGEYQGTGQGHRTQTVQDVKARKARGCELAFELATDLAINGTLPDGGLDAAKVRIATIVPFLVMKGMALAARLKEKDAWDIDYCIRFFPGGIETLAEEFRPHLQHGLVIEGLNKIAEKFSTVDRIGPKHVADFDEINDPEERALRQRDVYERVHDLLDRLGKMAPVVQTKNGGQ